MATFIKKTYFKSISNMCQSIESVQHMSDMDTLAKLKCLRFLGVYHLLMTNHKSFWIRGSSIPRVWSIVCKISNTLIGLLCKLKCNLIPFAIIHNLIFNKTVLNDVTNNQLPILIVSHFFSQWIVVWVSL